MSIPTQGPVAFSEIQAEFGGTNPISVSEYYLGGVNVPIGANTDGIPESGAIAISEFRGKTPLGDVVYELIGGGGAGGFGRADGGENYRGTFAQSGRDSTLSSSAFSEIVVPGGRGGENCKGARGSHGTNGGASFYGPGGRGGGENQNGSPAPSGSYGAGGGGGGGDDGSTFDSGGCSGEGGIASTRATGVLALRYGTEIIVVVGSGAPYNNNNYDGGAGARGYAVVDIDGTVTTYTTPNTYVLTV